MTRIIIVKDCNKCPYLNWNTNMHSETSMRCNKIKKSYALSGEDKDTDTDSLRVMNKWFNNLCPLSKK